MNRILIVLSIICMSYMQGNAQCAGIITYTTNPAPIAGGYAAGTVVQVCCTLSYFNMVGSNWFEGFSINLGSGWLPGSLNGVTAPVNLNGGGQWIWISTPFTVNGNFFGPGYFFDLNMDGISNDDFGDMGSGPWTMCFNVTAGNNNGASLSLSVIPLSDGVAGSWTSAGCGVPVVTPIITNAIVVDSLCTINGTVDFQTNITCFNDSNGTAALLATGGTPPYSYSLDGINLVQNPLFENLAAGNYNAFILDDLGCSVQVPFTITEPAPLSIALVFKINVNCQGDSNGKYRIVGNGGTGPYTYSINGSAYVPPNNGAAFQTIGLSAGTYNLFVKDFNGCIATLAIVLTEPTALTASIAAQTNISCSGVGTGSVTIAAAGGTPPYNYSIGGSFLLTETFNNLASGNYIVTIKDANNCSTTVAVSIAQSSTPIGSVQSQINVDCFGNSTGSFTFEGANGTAPYTYSIGGGSFGGAVVNNLAAGTYTVTVKEANGCTATFDATITQPQAINFTIGNQTNINCFGASAGAVVLNASNGTAPYTYTFGAISNTTGIFTGLLAGNAAFTVSDANGCTAAVNTTITQPATGMNVIIVAQNAVLCSGTNTGSFTLQSNNGVAPYSYTLNGTTNTTGTFNNLAAAVYNVTVTDASGCTNVQSVNLISPAALAASITAQTAVSCFGENNGSVTVTATSGSNPYSYTLDATSNSTGVFNSLLAGSYNVIINDQNGCTYTQAVTITQPAMPFAASVYYGGAAVICQGSQLQLHTDSNTLYSYQWMLNGTQLVSANAYSFMADAAGDYSVFVTNENSCTALSSSIFVTEATLPIIATSPMDTTITENNNAFFIVAMNVNDTASYNYQWQENNGTGFTDLINSLVYNGVNNDTLVINNVSLSFDSLQYRCIVSNSFCSTNSTIANLYVSELTALNSIEKAFITTIKIYPNPAKDFITIETNELNIGKQLKIFDIYGHLLLNTTITGVRFTITNLELAKGIYFICIDEHYYSEKVIIE